MLLAVKIQGNEKYRRLLGGHPQTKGMRAGYVNLKPGDEIGEHSTQSKEEAIIILSGKARIACDNRPPLIAATNTLIYVPVDTKHNVKNIGKTPLRYIYITLDFPA